MLLIVMMFVSQRRRQRTFDQPAVDPAAGAGGADDRGPLRTRRRGGRHRRRARARTRHPHPLGPSRHRVRRPRRQSDRPDRLVDRCHRQHPGRRHHQAPRPAPGVDRREVSA
nr:hypothetical protein [Angustibacter aerolatus]